MTIDETNIERKRLFYKCQFSVVYPNMMCLKELKI